MLGMHKLQKVSITCQKYANFELDNILFIVIKETNHYHYELFMFVIKNRIFLAGDKDCHFFNLCIHSSCIVRPPEIIFGVGKVYATRSSPLHLNGGWGVGNFEWRVLYLSIRVVNFSKKSAVPPPPIWGEECYTPKFF
jgi:hypothetical protein